MSGALDTLPAPDQPSMVGRVPPSHAFAERAADRVAARFGRRGFLARSALVGTALVASPANLLLRPKSAYAAICGCSGSSCDCGSLCCDGYTEFCCAINGVNACPPGSVTGGWWKVDGSSFCGGAARYYMDCHKTCGSCSCGGSGVCSGSCNGTPCGCGNGRCDHRKAGCTHFRYGNCSNHLACIGPIQCRVVSCTEPWKLEPTCSSSAVRTDNNTRNHNRPCLQTGPPIHPVVGNWDDRGGLGFGFYDNRDGIWSLRQALSGGSQPLTFKFGTRPGDLPVVGDFSGTGRTGIGVFRPGGQWYLRTWPSAGAAQINFKFGTRPGDLPVVGTWRTGRVGIGVFRPGDKWHLRTWPSAGAAQISFKFSNRPGDVPVVGDWAGTGRAGIGVFRPGGEWRLRNSATGGAAHHSFNFGRAIGDLPVVGDWTGSGRDSVGIYRPSEGTWYLRDSVDDGARTVVVHGPRWTTG